MLNDKILFWINLNNLVEHKTLEMYVFTIFLEEMSRRVI